MPVLLETTTIIGKMNLKVIKFLSVFKIEKKASHFENT